MEYANIPRDGRSWRRLGKNVVQDGDNYLFSRNSLNVLTFRMDGEHALSQVLDLFIDRTKKVQGDKMTIEVDEYLFCAWIIISHREQPQWKTRMFRLQCVKPRGLENVSKDFGRIRIVQYASRVYGNKTIEWESFRGLKNALKNRNWCFK